MKTIYLLAALLVSSLCAAQLSQQTPDQELTALLKRYGLDARPLETNSVPAAQGPVFELGRELFFSKALSRNLDVACASCHHPFLGGADQLSLPVGVGALDENLLGPGRTHDGNRNKDPLADGAPNVARNSQTIFNIHFYDRTMFWDGRIEVIDKQWVAHGKGQKIRTPDSIFRLADPDAGQNLSQAQAVFPLTSINEMFGHGPLSRLSNDERREIIIRRLQGKSEQKSLPKNDWRQAFIAAYGKPESASQEVITLQKVAHALSVYQQSQVFIDNPWFAYLGGDHNAISEQQKQGALLFYKMVDEGGYGCVRCHSGNNFSDEKFHNLAIPQFGRGKRLTEYDVGRMLVSSESYDKYRFRTPSVLNTEVTGPWGHTGAYMDLEGIVAHHMNVAAAVKQYDYSLAALQQFRFIPPRPDYYRQRAERALAVLKSSSDWQDLPKGDVNPLHVSQVVSFLKALTDPCVKKQSCLTPWLPDETQHSPDGLRLQAKFANHMQQKNSYQPRLESQAIIDAGAAGLYFSDVSIESGLDYEVAISDDVSMQHAVAGGVAVADYDKDGYLDFFVSHGTQPGKLFRNSTRASFLDVSSQDLPKLSESQFGGVFFDPDNDGDLDLLVTEDSDIYGYSRLLMNIGKGKFKDVGRKTGISFSRFSHSLSLADIDGDHYLDLYATHWAVDKHAHTPGYLWRNAGNGLFFDISAQVPDTPASPVPDIGNMDVKFTANFADIDGDNDPDLLISGDFETSQVLINDSGLFKDVTSAVISDENGMGGTVGDYDNDGDLDWFVTSIHNPVEDKSYIGGESGNRLYQNDGKGNFSDVTSDAGVREGFWGWGTCFADFNNDGWLDIFHTNGMTDGQSNDDTSFSQFFTDPSRLFINNQDGTFSERALEYGLDHNKQGRGISCLDYDNDGDLDILIANNGLAPTLYRNNNLDGKNYLAVELIGQSPNAMAVGAKVWLTAGGLTQFRELRLGSNYLSNDPLVQHFGLGDHNQISEVKIRWTDGTETVLTGVAVNQRLTIQQSTTH